MRGEVSGDVRGIGGGGVARLGGGKALDDPVHGFALFGSEALGVLEVFLPVVLDVALDAVQEVYSEVPDRGQVAVFSDPRDNGVQEISLVVLWQINFVFIEPTRRQRDGLNEHPTLLVEGLSLE